MAAAVFAQEAGVTLKPEAAEEVERVCADAGVEPKDLFYKWEAYAMKHGCIDSSPTAAHLAAVGSELERKAATKTPSKKPKRSSLTHRAPVMEPALGVDDFFSSYLTHPDLPIHAPAHTPVAAKRKEQPAKEGEELRDTMAVDAPAPGADERRDSIIVGGAALGGGVEDVTLPGDKDDSTSAAFFARQGTGKMLCQFNGGSTPQTPSVGPVGIYVLPRYATASAHDPFMYMNDSVGDVAVSLRTRLQVVGARILARRAASLDGAEDQVRAPSPEAFHAASPNVVLAMGRVRVELDGEAGTGRINSSSVVLESEDGCMVKLGLARMKADGKSVFLNPGMIVVVEGINTNGRIFDVHAIHSDSSPLPHTMQVPSVDAAKSPVARVAVAAGPYTLPGNLKYEPLDVLLETILPSQPDVVVLLGPFVDSSHSLVNEVLPVDFESLYQSRFLRRVSQASQRFPGTSFIVVPALGDVHHPNVCPQPALKPRAVDAGRGVHFVSNPCAISITNGAKSHAAVLGLSSLPAVLDMSSDSICSDSGDRLRSIVSHMVHQWSFYPQFPASTGVPLDASLDKKLEFPDCGLDVLISPSVLQPFAKCVEGDVFAVNPGMAVRGVKGGGAYAEISLPLHREASGLVKPCDSHGAPLNASTISAHVRSL